ncbi:MAG: signal peptide peptidase SppA [Bdellovibrionales bacterium]|nr:signal peptide peptidase SppA [Bdellovibrionales bacterium]
MGSFWKAVGTILILCFLGAIASGIFGLVGFLKQRDMELEPSKPGILALDLRGVIVDGRRFLKDLRHYAKEPDVKGILVRIDSPGGVVGASQEISAELKRIRTELKKPVVIHGMNLMASGAYYAAVAGDKIVVNPGTLVGSIGVIFELANLEKLYEWAKVKRYVIKTGKFKDTGAEYREMSADEHKYLQGTVDETLEQFKDAIIEGRKMKPEAVDEVADGRVFTGESALDLGLVDQIGTQTDAIRLIGALTGLGDDPELFEPEKERPNFMQFLVDRSGDDEEVARWNMISRAARLDLIGKPLFLMPGTWSKRM